MERLLLNRFLSGAGGAGAPDAEMRARRSLVGAPITTPAEISAASLELTSAPPPPLAECIFTELPPLAEWNCHKLGGRRRAGVPGARKTERQAAPPSPEVLGDYSSLSSDIGLNYCICCVIASEEGLQDLTIE